MSNVFQLPESNHSARSDWFTYGVSLRHMNLAGSDAETSPLLDGILPAVLENRVRKTLPPLMHNNRRTKLTGRAVNSFVRLRHTTELGLPQPFPAAVAIVRLARLLRVTPQKRDEARLPGLRSGLAVAYVFMSVAADPDTGNWRVRLPLAPDQVAFCLIRLSSIECQLCVLPRRDSLTFLG